MLTPRTTLPYPASNSTPYPKQHQIKFFRWVGCFKYQLLKQPSTLRTKIHSVIRKTTSCFSYTDNPNYRIIQKSINP